MHERIKTLRKECLGLTQEAFGKELGVSRSVIKNIELNCLVRPEQKEPIYKLICSTFNVNEEWLYKGIGNIFKNADDELVDYIADITMGEDEFIQNFIRNYMGLSDASKEIVRNLFSNEEKNKGAL